MKVKVKLSATRKFVLPLEDDTLGTLKAQIRHFVLQTYHEDVKEPVLVSLNGRDVLGGEDTTRLASLGVVPGDLLTVMEPPPAHPAPPPPRATPPQPAPPPKEHPKPKVEEKVSPPPPSMASPAPAPVFECEGGVGVGGGGGGGGGGWCRVQLMEAVDGTAPAALEELLVQCGPASLSGALNLVLHLTMLECGFLLDGEHQPPPGGAHPPPPGGSPPPPPGWAESVAVFPYRSVAHPSFRCKLVLMDLGPHKQVMASFPEQAGEVKHSLAMQDHLKGSSCGRVVARDLLGVAQLSRRLRDAVLLPLQVAAHQTLGVPAPWHMAGLPQELVLAVAAKLDYRAVVSLASTCRRLRAVLADNRLWHDLYRRDFPPTEGSVGGATAGQDWKDRYKQAINTQKERERLRKEGHYVFPVPFSPAPFPGQPLPYPYPHLPQPSRPNPFMDPDSPYFPGEIPPVPGVYPDMPDPLGPLGPGGPLGPLQPRWPHPQPHPFMPSARPRNSRGPRFDFFM